MYDFATYTKVHEAYIEQMFNDPAKHHYYAAQAAERNKHKCKFQIKGHCIIR